MDLEAIYRICVDDLERFVRDRGFCQVVIGLSGGIDSSLVAVMACDALGSENVHGVLLPGPYSSESSITDALSLASNLQMDCMTIPITKPYAAFASVISDATGKAFEGLASENTQARCRTVCLMALSNEYGWMMLNTGNKSEAAMGYSTLYGDTAGAFAPIGGIYKTDVFRLCEWRNAQAEKAGQIPPIPENVILKPPSAELCEDQSDEAAMGIAYKDLDEILIGVFERGLSIDDLVSKGLDRLKIEEVLRRYHAYAFKREQEPPFPDQGFYK